MSELSDIDPMKLLKHLNVFFGVGGKRLHNILIFCVGWRRWGWGIRSDEYWGEPVSCLLNREVQNTGGAKY